MLGAWAAELVREIALKGTWAGQLVIRAGADMDLGRPGGHPQACGHGPGRARWSSARVRTWTWAAQLVIRAGVARRIALA